MTSPEPLPDLGVCPSCGSSNVNAIWYGMPSPDYKETWPPNTQVGGCSITEDNPTRACLSCGARWITLGGEGD